MKIFLTNPQILEYASNSLMIIFFFSYVIHKRNSLDKTSLLIEAIAITLVAKEIPRIFLIILCAYNPSYLGQIDNLSSTLTLIGLILLFYVYRILITKFK